MQFKNTSLDLSTPQIMGVLNVTPDSFSDGGRFVNMDDAVAQALRMIDEGASIIDVGGESTRPGAEEVSAQQELDRVIPVIEKIHQQTDAVISIDTSKPSVMHAAVAAGAAMVNDVNALRAPDALATVAALNVPVCLMHMQGTPRTMQAAPQYENVIDEVIRFLIERAEACVSAGIHRDQIVLDPGFGFGKSVAHNLALVKNLPALIAKGYPVLVGVSRKSTIGAVLDKPVEQRLYGSLALAGLAVWLGASIIRVHDVAQTADTIKMLQAVKFA